VIGRRQASVTKPTRISLAQFSKSLMARKSQDRPAVVDSTECLGLESVGQKRFAADVVAALSNHAVKANEEIVELPKPQFTTATNEGGLKSKL